MKYWPDDVHTTLNVGSRFTVTLTSTIPSAEYQIRKLQVNSVSTERKTICYLTLPTFSGLWPRSRYDSDSHALHCLA